VLNEGVLSFVEKDSDIKSDVGVPIASPFLCIRISLLIVSSFVG